jgi:NAD(P)-dependent dehydrogenase (short-subunit alcohol dehydrogenase family)
MGAKMRALGQLDEAIEAGDGTGAAAAMGVHLEPLKARPHIFEALAAHTVFSRWSEPGEVAAAVAFLASDAASFVTGSAPRRWRLDRNRRPAHRTNRDGTRLKG